VFRLPARRGTAPLHSDVFAPRRQTTHARRSRTPPGQARRLWRQATASAAALPPAARIRRRSRWSGDREAELFSTVVLPAPRRLRSLLRRISHQIRAGADVRPVDGDRQRAAQATRIRMETGRGIDHGKGVRVMDQRASERNTPRPATADHRRRGGFIERIARPEALGPRRTPVPPRDGDHRSRGRRWRARRGPRARRLRQFFQCAQEHTCRVSA
jgi:hypothetical protein